MCGLVGTGYFDKDKQPIESKVVRDTMSQFMLTELLVESIPRGEHATGIGLISDDSGYAYIKAGWEAHKLMTYDNPDCDVTKLIKWWNGHNVTFAMGHDRKRTVGPEWDNHNNHPIHRDNIIMVHNGTIVNQESIYKEIKEKVGPPKGVVDSEAIAAYLEAHFNDKKFTAEGIQDMAKKLDGAFTVFAMNRLFPKQLLVTRTGRTLSMCYNHKLNFIAMISDDKFLKPVLKLWNRHIARNEQAGYPKLEIEDFEIVSIAEDNAIILDLQEVPGHDFKKYLEERLFNIRPMKTSASSSSWTGNTHSGTTSYSSNTKSTTTGYNSYGSSTTTGPSKYANNSTEGCFIKDAVKLERDGNKEVAKVVDKPTGAVMEHPTVKSVEENIDYLGESAWAAHLEKVVDTITDEIGSDGIAALAEDVVGDFKDVTNNLQTVDKHQIDEAIRAAVAVGVKEGVRKGVDTEYTRWNEFRKTYLDEITRLGDALSKSSGVSDKDIAEAMKTLKQMVLGLLKAGQSGEVPRDKILDYLVLAHDLPETSVKKLFSSKELDSFKVE